MPTRYPVFSQNPSNIDFVTPPVAPTLPLGTNTTQLATTQFVNNAIANAAASGGVPKASAAQSGVVKTNISDAGNDPVVYLKGEVDTLLDTKQPANTNLAQISSLVPVTGDFIVRGTTGYESRVLTANDIPGLTAGKITSGTFADGRIPTLDASKITSGTFSANRIPSLDATKITTGTFDSARIGSDIARLDSPTFAGEVFVPYVASYGTGTTAINRRMLNERFVFQEYLATAQTLTSTAAWIGVSNWTISRGPHWGGQFNSGIWRTATGQAGEYLVILRVVFSVSGGSATSFNIGLSVNGSHINLSSFNVAAGTTFWVNTASHIASILDNQNLQPIFYWNGTGTCTVTATASFIYLGS